jgi:hypothetical protein
MVAARKPDADNCEVSCLFYTSYLSGAAERTAEYILWDVLHAGAIEGQMKYQTIWVSFYEANARFVQPLTLNRACTSAGTIQGTTN